MKDVILDYRLYHDRTVTLRETILNLFNRKTSREWFRALSNVTFTIAPGEQVAIIGANGAGKSSTLKLLANIYEPTSGRVNTTGRIASLLDLGVGFHPDLTGEENIFLNGALIGLNRSEMQNLIPEIAEFAELERFMDTPVKYYSSGMFMRLGFSLATTVDPDILLIDEVLAVGDSRFQEKCYDRIWDFRKRGKTIIFVSHDAEAVSRLCTRAILLDDGKILRDGDVNEVLAEYSSGSQKRISTASTAPREWGSMEIRFDSVTLKTETGVPSRIFRKDEKLIIDAKIRSVLPEMASNIVFGFSLHRTDGETVIACNNLEMNQGLLEIGETANCILELDLEVIEPGTYLLGLALTDPQGGKDYHWQEYFYPVTLLDQRRNPPVKLRKALWIKKK